MDELPEPWRTAAERAGRGIYGVEVSHRGVVQVKEADLGAIALKLG